MFLQKLVDLRAMIEAVLIVNQSIEADQLAVQMTQYKDTLPDISPSTKSSLTVEAFSVSLSADADVAKMRGKQ